MFAKYLNSIAGLVLAAVAALLPFGVSAQSSCVMGCTTPPAPNMCLGGSCGTPTQGVTVFGQFQGATLSQGNAFGTGQTLSSQTYGKGETNVLYGVDLKSIVGPGCTVNCANNSALITITAQQLLGAGAMNSASSTTGGASSTAGTSTAGTFYGGVGVRWTPPSP